MHMYPCWLCRIKEIGKKEPRAFQPCLLDVKCYHLGGTNFSKTLNHVVSCTLLAVSATFLPFSRTLLSWLVFPVTPLPLGPAEASSSSPASAVTAAAAHGRAQGSCPFNWHTAVLSQFIVKKLLFFKPLWVKFESELFFFLFCSFFFM